MPRPQKRTFKRRDNRPRSQNQETSAPRRSSPVTFPQEWAQIFDTLVPSIVKNRYSPKEAWKDKPFSDLDCRFFSKGVLELSENFTYERTDGPGTRRSKLGPYFSQAKYRSSYLLYFLPLQAAKFLALFQMNPDALEPLLKPRSNETLEILDVGAGPGTASIALILELLRRAGTSQFPKINFTWIDANKEILEDGKRIVESFIEKHPSLQGKITLNLISGDWLTSIRSQTKPFSLIMLGNVLNELSGSELQSDKRFHLLAEIVQRSGGGGTLFIEPAEKIASQILSQLRDRLVSDEVIPAESSSIWGPCLHAGTCPLANAKDWCHFSVPVKVPGKWFAQFSNALGSERDWLKFSYLWLSSPDAPNPEKSTELRRAVSDSLRERDGSHTLLLCEPDQTYRLKLRPTDRFHRGDLVEKRSITVKR